MFWYTKFSLTGGILRMLPSLVFFLGLKWFAMITCRKWKINSLRSSRYHAKRPVDVSESTERSPPPQQPLRGLVPSPASLCLLRQPLHLQIPLRLLPFLQSSGQISTPHRGLLRLCNRLLLPLSVPFYLRHYSLSCPCGHVFGSGLTSAQGPHPF